MILLVIQKKKKSSSLNWELRLGMSGFENFVSSKTSPFSLREIISTDAGQLSDRLQSFAGQIRISRTESIFVVRILFFC